MLGEQLTELKGKEIGQRVLELEPMVMETTVSAKGTVKGVQVTVLLTFVGSPTDEAGVLHGKGKGLIMVVGGKTLTRSSDFELTI